MGGYYVSQTLDLNRIVHWEGAGHGYQIGGEGDGTELWFPDVTGIRLNQTNTDNLSTLANNGASTVSIFRGITCRSIGSSNANAHGWHFKATPLLYNCGSEGFGGNAYRIRAGAGYGGEIEGNANGWKMYDCFAKASGLHALWVDHADANAGICSGLVIANCGGGILDSSYLGNRYIGPQIANAYSGVSHGGNLYVLIDNAAGSGAATTPGSSAPADQVWYFLSAGAPQANFPAWSGAGSYTMKLPFYRGTGGQCELIGLYNEGSMPSRVGPGSIAIGGTAIFTDYSHNIGSYTSQPFTFSNRGMGGARTYSSGKRGYTENGALTYAAVGVFEADAAEGINILYHRRESDGSFDWKQKYTNTNLIVYQAATVTPTWNITNANSTEKFGRSANQICKMFFTEVALAPLSDTPGGRILAMAAAAPTGDHAQGEIVFNNTPTLTVPARWVCTVSHATTPTWGADYIYARAEPLTGVGYVTGAGGAVTQITSRTTGVTLNKVCGSITLVSAVGSATWASFTVTNSAVAATDTVVVSQKSGTDKYMIHVTNVAAGSFQVTSATTGGVTTEQPVFNFAVIKAAAA